MNSLSWLLCLLLRLIVVKYRTSKTIGIVNALLRNIEEVMVPPPLVVRMAQAMGNFKRLIELQTYIVEI